MTILHYELLKIFSLADSNFIFCHNYISRQACYYLSPSGSSNFINAVDAAVACGLKENGARLAVTVTKTELDSVKAAIGYQTTDSGTGKIWMGL